MEKARKYKVLAVDHNDKDNKDYFTQIGMAWPLKDGKKGMSVRLNALPLNSNLIIMLDEPKQQNTTQEDF